MTRGGKRDGAGRPTKDGIPRKKLTLALRTDLLAQLIGQSQALGMSLADHVNQMLAAQLQPSASAAEPVKAQVSFEKSIPNQKPAAPAVQSQKVDPTLYDRLLKQVDDLDRELALPLDDDESEKVPTPKELQSLLQGWTGNYINRRSQPIQYWRKHYRQDGAFRKAMDHLAAWTHADFRDLLLDNRLPIGTHDEALALSVLPAKALKLTAARLLKGERDLKRALKGYEESFRQAVTHQYRHADPSRSAYRFDSELGF